MSNIWHKNVRDTSSPVHLSLLLFMYTYVQRQHKNASKHDIDWFGLQLFIFWFKKKNNNRKTSSCHFESFSLYQRDDLSVSFLLLLKWMNSTFIFFASIPFNIHINW